MNLNSSTTLYLPVAEFLLRVDQGSVAQLATNNASNPVYVLSTDLNVLAAIKDACGVFESATLRGEMYELTDLHTLASTDCMARSLMYRIVADIAWALLWERRPNKNSPPPPSLQRSMAFLDELEQGKKIFGFTETEDAGHQKMDIETPEEVRLRNGAVVQSSRYWGTRADRGCPPLR